MEKPCFPLSKIESTNGWCSTSNCQSTLEIPRDPSRLGQHWLLIACHQREFQAAQQIQDAVLVDLQPGLRAMQRCLAALWFHRLIQGIQGAKPSSSLGKPGCWLCWTVFLGVHEGCLLNKSRNVPIATSQAGDCFVPYLCKPPAIINFRWELVPVCNTPVWVCPGLGKPEI